MDNVAFHKTKEVKDFIKSTNSQTLFIPPYSPEFNPIELAFSKIKTMYRKLCLVNDTNKQENVKKSITALTTSDLLQFFKHVDTFIDS
jgi:transposase